MSEISGRAKGGVARAEKLSSERKSEIARKAAQARWAAQFPKADYTGSLQIGDLSVPCAVLPDGTRVLSQRGIGRALGRGFGGANWKGTTADGAAILPFYLNSAQLKDFIPNDLLVLLSQPKMYRHSKGGGVALGLVATALPQVCNVWLSAREAHYRNDIKLSQNLLDVAQRAEIIMRGLAEVGIVALVDEATGYQEARDREALQEILNAFLRKELAAWAKRFPDEFYRQIYRLRGWQMGKGSSRSHAVAHYTKDIVYARLAPGIIEELERRNPSDHGRRKARHHQWLTDDVGHPALAQHLYAVITLMRVANSWDQFKSFLDSAHPVRGDTLQMPLMLEQATEPAPTSSLSSAPIEPLPLFERLNDGRPQ